MAQTKTYKIRTFQDIVDALHAHPDWREEIRRMVLTGELMELPHQFREFREQEFKPLVKRVEHLEGDVAVLKQDVAILKEDVTILKQDVKVLKQDVGQLKGGDLERRVRERAHAYLGRLLRRARVISANALAQALDEALEQGQIDEAERAEALWADVVVQGRLKHGEERIVVGEVSSVVDKEDVQRALRRAEVIGRVFGMPAVPVVFGASVTQGAQKILDEGTVLFIHAE